MQLIETDKQMARLYHGDCLEVLDTLEAASFDLCLTDPPYHLLSIVKRFGGKNAAPAKSEGATGVYKRSSVGFMGQTWDGGDIAQRVETWEKVKRVMKPGAHLIAFSGTRTYHRMACAIEDAGFEIRDMVGWLYGTGFPKSHDVAKNLAKMGIDPAEWEGWGTALKPAFEPCVLARVPLSEKTVAANVRAHRAGAINIDACRVPSAGGIARSGEASQERRYTDNGSTNFAAKPGPRGGGPNGRHPANIVHDGSDDVLAAFPYTKSGAMKREVEGYEGKGVTGFIRGRSGPSNQHGDEGSAARFFYHAKADKTDRAGSEHPTVKPINLMGYFARLITPPGGMILDPFAGSGTTGTAALNEGFNVTLIEREAKFYADVERRIGRWADDYVLGN